DLHTAMLGMTLRPEWPGTATLLSAGGPAALTGQIGRMSSMQAVDDLYLVLSACCALGVFVALLWWRPPTAAESA
ncbi:MAG TPA: hypothetical protein VF153_06755, partial [Candidatus Limnocylindria bacterium]